MNFKEKQNYPYAWLDEVIEVTLNPTKTDLATIEAQQLKLIEDQFNAELSEILHQLKENTFNLLSFKKIKAIVVQYYHGLCILQKQASANLEGYPADHPLIYTGENLLQYLQNVENQLKLRYAIYLKDVISPPLNNQFVRTSEKIICRLSVDQLGIILRAADDIKLILANSISLIFQRVVPFLATERRTDISWNSMRKSSYQIEESDKEVVIAVLEKLIRQIKGY